MNRKWHVKKIISLKDNDYVYFLLVFTQQNIPIIKYFPFPL